MVVEMMQPLGGHRISDRITVDQVNAQGWVEVPLDMLDDYVAAGYVKVVES